MTEQPNYITLEDNTDRTPPEAAQMSEGQEQKSEGGSFLSKPEEFGNSAGQKIQDGLAPVGNTVGKGLETAAKPIGGLVDPVVGGVMRSGEAFGDQVGVGYGNKEGGPAKQQEAEGKKMKEDIGGKEQTADNPLGL